MYAQGLPDPRSRSYNFLIGSTAPSSTSSNQQTRPYSVSKLESLQHIKLSSGAQAFQLSTK